MSGPYAFRTGNEEHKENTRWAIRHRKQFKTGGEFGGVRSFSATGFLNETEAAAYRAQRGLMDYVVISYFTPIAWHTPQNGWHLVDQKFSQTTGRHQAFLRGALDGYQ